MMILAAVLAILVVKLSFDLYIERQTKKVLIRYIFVDCGCTLPSISQIEEHLKRIYK